MCLKQALMMKDSEGIEEGKTVHKISGFKQISSLFIFREKK